MIIKEELKVGMKVRWIAHNKKYIYLCDSPSGLGVVLQHDGTWQQFKKWNTFLKCFEIVK